jgi:Flp pilus assembly pilin Flp
MEWKGNTYYNNTWSSIKALLFFISLFTGGRHEIVGRTTHAAASRRRVWERALARLAGKPTALGQGLVEYALILVLIAAVTIGIVSQLGMKTSSVFSRVNCTLDGGQVAQSSSSHPGNPQGGGGGLGNNTTTTTTGGC